MKMSNKLYEKIEKVFSENKELIIEHKKTLIDMELKGLTKINDLNVRLSWDVYHALISKKFRHDIDEEDLYDSHIQTGLLKALKANGLHK